MFGYIKKEDALAVQMAWIIAKADVNNGLTKYNLRLLLHGIHNLWCPSWMTETDKED
jgi:hypothetical protein